MTANTLIYVDPGVTWTFSGNNATIPAGLSLSLRGNGPTSRVVLTGTPAANTGTFDGIAGTTFNAYQLAITTNGPLVTHTVTTRIDNITVNLTVATAGFIGTAIANSITDAQVTNVIINAGASTPSDAFVGASTSILVVDGYHLVGIFGTIINIPTGGSETVFFNGELLGATSIATISFGGRCFSNFTKALGATCTLTLTGSGAIISNCFVNNLNCNGSSSVYSAIRVTTLTTINISGGIFNGLFTATLTVGAGATASLEFNGLIVTTALTIPATLTFSIFQNCMISIAGAITLQGNSNMYKNFRITSTNLTLAGFYNIYEGFVFINGPTTITATLNNSTIDNFTVGSNQPLLFTLSGGFNRVSNINSMSTAAALSTFTVTSFANNITNILLNAVALPPAGTCFNIANSLNYISNIIIVDLHAACKVIITGAVQLNTISNSIFNCVVEVQGLGTWIDNCIIRSLQCGDSPATVLGACVNLWMSNTAVTNSFSAANANNKDISLSNVKIQVLATGLTYALAGSQHILANVEFISAAVSPMTFTFQITADKSLFTNLTFRTAASPFPTDTYHLLLVSGAENHFYNILEEVTRFDLTVAGNNCLIDGTRHRSVTGSTIGVGAVTITGDNMRLAHYSFLGGTAPVLIMNWSGANGSLIDGLTDSGASDIQFQFSGADMRITNFTLLGTSANVNFTLIQISGPRCTFSNNKICTNNANDPFVTFTAASVDSIASSNIFGVSGVAGSGCRVNCLAANPNEVLLVGNKYRQLVGVATFGDGGVGVSTNRDSSLFPW